MTTFNVSYWQTPSMLPVFYSFTSNAKHISVLLQRTSSEEEVPGPGLGTVSPLLGVSQFSTLCLPFLPSRTRGRFLHSFPTSQPCWTGILAGCEIVSLCFHCNLHQAHYTRWGGVSFQKRVDQSGFHSSVLVVHSFCSFFRLVVFLSAGDLSEFCMWSILATYQKNCLDVLVFS